MYVRKLKITLLDLNSKIMLWVLNVLTLVSFGIKRPFFCSVVKCYYNYFVSTSIYKWTLLHPLSRLLSISRPKANSGPVLLCKQARTDLIKVIIKTKCE